jgi:hypothetical protein
VKNSLITIAVAGAIAVALSGCSILSSLNILGGSPASTGAAGNPAPVPGASSTPPLNPEDPPCSSVSDAEITAAAGTALKGAGGTKTFHFGEDNFVGGFGCSFNGGEGTTVFFDVDTYGPAYRVSTETQLDWVRQRAADPSTKFVTVKGAPALVTSVDGKPTIRFYFGQKLSWVSVLGISQAKSIAIAELIESKY